MAKTIGDYIRGGLESESRFYRENPEEFVPEGVSRRRMGMLQAILSNANQRESNNLERQKMGMANQRALMDMAYQASEGQKGAIRGMMESMANLRSEKERQALMREQMAQTKGIEEAKLGESMKRLMFDKEARRQDKEAENQYRRDLMKANIMSEFYKHATEMHSMEPDPKKRQALIDASMAEFQKRMFPEKIKVPQESLKELLGGK